MNSQAQQKCRWGIISTASISRKNWNSIRFAENATLTAVASRDQAKAQTYIDENQLPLTMKELSQVVLLSKTLRQNSSIA